MYLLEGDDVAVDVEPDPRDADSRRLVLPTGVVRPLAEDDAE